MRSCPQCGFDCDAAHKFCPSCGFPISQIAKDTEDPLIGRRLPGGYVILELVGIGGMGRVYRAEQTNLGRTVAIKIIHPHLVGEENAAARFITEARAASRLNHPNSVSIIDFGKTNDDQLYLVMEFLRGRDLARVAYDEGPLPFRRIIEILRQVLAALGEAHHNEIIHRDLKPENVILEPMRAGGDFVKVVDFGLAKMRIESAPSITSPGIVCGTPEYMSPEQGRGDPLDSRSDIYAVGVILFQLLVGRLPFEAESPTQVVLMHISKPPPDPRNLVPSRLIPESLVAVLMRALAKEPDDRFPDTDTFAAALLRTLPDADLATSARSATLSSVRCQRCGAMNAVSQKFCGECGASMTPLDPPEQVVIPKPTRVQTGSQSGITAIVPASERGGRPRFPLPLVGRDDDLAWLEERRAAARTGLAAARVVGDSGMGKTRLVREFLMIAAASGDVVVVGSPDPTWAEVGFYTLRKVIQALAGLPPDGGSSRSWVAAGPEARQGLADVFNTNVLDADAVGAARESASSVARLSPDVRRYAAAEALRWSLVRANERSGGRRAVLAIDDLQCVDGASRNAIADCVAEPPLVPVLLVAAHTPEFRPEWPTSSGAPRIIGGLPGAVVTKMLASTQTPSAPSLSGGRGIPPLYVDHLVRFLHEHGSGAPERLADLIALRVERLPADARRLLQAIAVVGDDATPSMLAPLLASDSSSGAQPAAARDVLVRAGMIEPVGDGDASRTAHPLLRDVVLASIPAAVRKRLHAIAAEGAQDRSAPLEVRAMHELHAQNAFEALILLERVSAVCAARGDLAGNILALRRGLELARRELFRGELDDPMRAVLIFSRKLGEALALAGAYMDAEGILREALDMAGPSGQDRARVLGALAHVAHGRERRQEAQAYLREALELAARSNSRELVSSLEDLKRAIAS